MFETCYFPCFLCALKTGRGNKEQTLEQKQEEGNAEMISAEAHEAVLYREGKKNKSEQHFISMTMLFFPVEAESNDSPEK